MAQVVSDTNSAPAERSLAERIADSRSENEVVQARLTTDERVLARVTDGIYREPSSALRELISNAYDADASEVVIQTDRPRFSSITITDNGNGMSPEVLAHVIEHIGGSAKRSPDGGELGVTRRDNSFLSPGGRRLIGRIGIGLFSVSQLTHSFQIITKVAGDPWRTVAVVRLRTFSDEASDVEKGPYEAGLVSIWRVAARDVEASGTTIVLTDLQRHTVRTLSDADRWYRVHTGEKPPRYHVGRLERGELVSEQGKPADSLPWKDSDDGLAAFTSLVDAVWEELSTGSSRNPSIDFLFDKYLQTVWEIALAAPLAYVGAHPLLVGPEEADRYVFEANKREPARPLSEGSLASALEVADDIGTGKQPFSVFVDNLELRRPIRLEGLPSTSHAVKKPLVFADRVREEFGGADSARSGGPLEFIAYIMWAPKIAPIEHRGALIRVHGASGTLFDETFLDYGIAETTRLRQLTCEIFVTQGFESALNIDREGFNQAHPHARRITSWLHASIGRAINTEKTLASRIRKESQAAAAVEREAELDRIAKRTWRQRQAGSGEPPPVTWAYHGGGGSQSNMVDSIRLEPETVLGERRASPSAERERRTLAAIAQILAAYNLLEDLSPEETNELMKALAAALRVEP
ncbi:ATP-binding protein [Micromonospora hortensis]|uniref:ATP-binding protein n=1 Tax=Micromonospora hortensis TaxID=2911209 RepID=UPI001EE9396B|nr:ATP-binding protein [Micromonospora hortensis]MCG5450778.1 ATP-binding protein [Micromonospora hortensis]